jgi:hypothetical protein
MNPAQACQEAHVMNDKPIGLAGENAGNPYAAPQAEIAEQWGAGDPELEAIRRAHRKEEAYIKALVRWHLALALLCAIFACTYLSFPIRHALGQINAPWVSKWNIVLCCMLLVAAPALGMLGAYALHRRKPWALRVESLLVLILFSALALPLANRDSPAAASDFVMTWILSLILTLPFLNLLELRGSKVLGSDYLRVMGETSYIRVKPKLPLMLKLLMIALGVVFIALGYLKST